MKTIWKLVFRKPGKPSKPGKKKKELLPTLLDKLMGIPLELLQAKWIRDLWDPNF